MAFVDRVQRHLQDFEPDTTYLLRVNLRQYRRARDEAERNRLGSIIEHQFARLLVS
jgi:hypothetical protein